MRVWFNNLSKYLNEGQCNSENNGQRYEKEVGELY